MPSEFDALAHRYDAEFTATAVGRAQRERVWKVLAKWLGVRADLAAHPLTALELNCGTGEDAIWLAKQGWKVIATDASAEMVAVASAKAGVQLSESFKLSESSVQVKVCAFSDIGKLPEGDFDLVFSNFGGLNCIPPEDLEKLGEAIAQKLKPGGRFAAVVMGRFCWWETLYYLLRGNPVEAFRRLGKKPAFARLDAHTSVPTWYYSPGEIQKHLLAKVQGASAKAQASAVNPIGFWVPPSYLNPFFEKRTKMLGILHFLERHFAPSWLAFAADHFMICLSKTKSS